MVTIRDSDKKRATTVGRLCDSEVKIVLDENGNPAPDGQTGEIWWRGSDSTYGYVNSIENDNACFDRDGFYKSGDVGFIDQDGYLHITGRIKEMIIRGGQNISPRAIEESLASHPKILEIAVAAMPDLVFGERVCVFVVPGKTEKITFEEIISFLESKNTAKWNLPERLEILDKIPKSAGGKIMKKALTEMITEKLKKEGTLPADFKPRVKV